MNERIRELAKPYLMHEWFSRYGESTVEDYYDFLPEELAEFAELIVKECAGINLKSPFQDGEFHAREVLEHFGVEE